MLVFFKLCLAHLIGDFILQFDELFQLKLKSLAGHILHALCHVAVSLLLLWPYLDDFFFWKFVFAVSTVHLAQDLVKYRLMVRQKKYFFPIFIIDQAVHFLVLSSIFLFPQHNRVLGFVAWPLLNELYTENLWTLYAIVFVAATFAGSFVLHAFRLNFVPATRPDHFITTPEIIHGLLERSLVVWLFVFAPTPWALALSPLIGLPRLAFKRLTDKTDFFLSFDFAALTGLIFRFSQIL